TTRSSCRWLCRARLWRVWRAELCSRASVAPLSVACGRLRGSRTRAPRSHFTKSGPSSGERAGLCPHRIALTRAGAVEQGAQLGARLAGHLREGEAVGEAAYPRLAPAHAPLESERAAAGG